MSIFYTDDAITLHHGDALDVLRGMPDASVDAVVTDPPYGLEFMGKDWDGADGFRRSLNPADVERESVFGRTSRTSPEYRTESKATAGMQRGGVSAADGRPTFLGGLNPKCLACGKWQRGSNPCRCESPEFTNERLPRLHAFQEWCEAWATECLRVLKPGGHLLAFGGTRTWHRLTCAIEDAGFEVRDSIAWLYGSGFPKSLNLTDETGARTGWGTALKPAHEPIVVARKPLAGTVAANVLEHGTGALNVDGCRVNPGDAVSGGGGWAAHKVETTEGWDRPYVAGVGRTEAHDAGRWPTNVVLDDAAAAELDRQSGVTMSAGGSRGAARASTQGASNGGQAGGFNLKGSADPLGFGDQGGASRFFPVFRYEAKAPTSERPRDGQVAHPTVKPLDLMRWLVRLVTPAGGLVLDPFAGSGTTAEACVIEGLRCVTIEREADYLPLIVQRLTKPIAPVLDLGEWSA